MKYKHSATINLKSLKLFVTPDTFGPNDNETNLFAGTVFMEGFQSELAWCKSLG